jgi:hypothetical protein
VLQPVVDKSPRVRRVELSPAAAVASLLCTTCFVRTHGADSLLALTHETSRRGFVTFKLGGLVSRFRVGPSIFYRTH